MKIKLRYFIFIIFLLGAIFQSALCEENEIKFDTIPRNYIFFPKPFKPLDYSFHVGIGITKIPMQVVEEEISYSPMPLVDFRLGLPFDLSLYLKANSNYISNHGSVGLQWSDSIGNIFYSLGANTSAWFGHLQLDAIKLYTWGLIFSPNVSIGIDFGSLLFSTQLETQHHIFWTYAEKEFLGKLKKFDGGFAVRFCAEQPLWNQHWVALTLKLNYAKFNYQSWISYTTVDEYLFYPEFIFGFIL